MIRTEPCGTWLNGESTFIGLNDLDQLADDTVSIMRQFGDLLENRVYLKDYRAA